jgi:2-dehydropantoate 2-reductase
MTGRERVLSKRRYAIIGTGALGGYYGSCLAHAGIEVHFLLNSDYDHVREHGLVVESVNGDFTLPDVHAWNDARAMPPCDVVIVALKATNNDLLAELVPPPLTKDGVVLLFQNGLGVETELAAMVGDDRVMGGLCFLCSNKLGPGHIKHLDYGHISLGEYRAGYAAGGLTDRMQAIADDFAKAGIDATPKEDLLQARWSKLVWNIPFNGLSVVLGAGTEALIANDETRTLSRDLMVDVQRGAAADGRVIETAFIDQMIEYTRAMKPYKTSMMLDHAAGRPLEVEAIFGNPLRAARAQGVELERLAVLYAQLVFIDAQLRA